MTRKWNSLSFVLIAIGLVSACTSSSSSESNTLDMWVEKHITKDETLLCQREVNGEFFFVARMGDRVKLGSRLDVTGTSANKPVNAFIRAWQFQNENNKHLVTNVPPSTVKEELVKSDTKLYAEDIQYQTLHLPGSQKIRVTIHIKKCPTGECDRQQKISNDEIQYTVELCEASLTQQTQ
jgi:hypothetical protein